MFVQQHYIIAFVMLWQSISILWRFWWKSPVSIQVYRSCFHQLTADVDWGSNHCVSYRIRAMVNGFAYVL